MVGFRRLLARDGAPGTDLDDLHLRSPERRGRHSERGPPVRTRELREIGVLDDPPTVAVSVGIGKPEPATGEERVVVGETREVDEGFEVMVCHVLRLPGGHVAYPDRPGAPVHAGSRTAGLPHFGSPRATS